MTKFVLIATSAQWSLSPAGIASLQRCGIRTVYVRSWTQVMSACRAMKIDLILGCCNVNSRRICTIINSVNKHYASLGVPGAFVILREVRYKINRAKYSLIESQLLYSVENDLPENILVDKIITWFRFLKPTPILQCVG